MLCTSVSGRLRRLRPSVTNIQTHGSPCAALPSHRWGPVRPATQPSRTLKLSSIQTRSGQGPTRQPEMEVLHDDWFQSVCGDYTVQPAQLEVFQHFSARLKQAGVAFSAVAFTNVALTLLQEPTAVLRQPASMFAKITVGNFALWADSVVVACMTLYGASAFRLASDGKGENCLPLIFQGISRLTMVLQQLGIAAAALGAVHMLEAATVFPPILRIAAYIFISVSTSRGLLLRWLAHRHPGARGGIIPEMVAAVHAGDSSGLPQWERWAMRYVLGHLVAFNIPPAQDGSQPLPQMATDNNDRHHHHHQQQQQQQQRQASSHGASTSEASGDAGRDESKPAAGDGEPPPPYYFNRAELQLVRMCIDGMHFAGFMLGSQGIATGLLGLACVGAGDFARAFSMASNGASKAFSALLLFGASTAFDRTFVIPSCHVCNLVDGIGPGGLTDLFHKLTLFSWSVVATQALQLVVPWLQHSPLSMLVAGQTLGPHLTQALMALQNALAGI